MLTGELKRGSKSICVLDRFRRMMANASWRLIMTIQRPGLFFLLCAPAITFGEATLSLKAVAKNGVVIMPTNSLSIAANDVITADIFLSGWNNPPFDGGTGTLSTFQVTLLGQESVLSGGICPGGCNSHYILPLGWVAAVEKDMCPCDDPCFSICNPAYGCVGSNFNTNSIARIDHTRFDWIFRGFDAINGVDVSSLNIRWASTINGSDGQTASRCTGGSGAGFSCSTNTDCPGGTCNANFQSYLGTLYLKAGSAVCGTYYFTFTNNSSETFISNPAGSPVTIVPILQGLTLVAPLCPGSPGACCNENTETCSEGVLSCACTGRWGGPNSTCATMDPPCAPPTGACCTGSNPCGTGSAICTNAVRQEDCTGRWGGEDSTCATLHPPCWSSDVVVVTPNCVIDARRPFPPNQPNMREGFNTWTWMFPNSRTTGENSPDDFTIRQVPSTTPPVPPTIASVTPVGANGLTLQFSEPIQPNKWTCVKHDASGCERCLGYLPGDVNSNRAALPNDILTIIDNLNNVIPDLQLYQCDTDRSGVCVPADILTEIDLINGVNGYPVQNGKTLEACPSP